MTWQIARDPVHSDTRFGNLRSIVQAQSEDSGGYAPAQVNPVHPFALVMDTSQVFGEPRVEGSGL
jgi:hypothetical protein